MKAILISIFIVIVAVGLTIAVAVGSSKTSRVNDGSNVVMLEGKQIITITAKGGYSPWTTTAKADTPTVFKIVTKGTFDCSAALVVPSVGYRQILPPSGETVIDIPPQKAGSVVQGICAMGMYSFTVKFN